MELIGAQYTYCAFRRAVLEKHEAMESFKGWQHCAEDGAQLHPMKVLRAQIETFRGLVAYGASEMLSNAPDIAPHVRRALGIPAAIPLTPDRWSVAGQCGLRLLSESIRFRRAWALLSQIRSFEGRMYVFEQFARKLFPALNHYCKAVDFALRYFELPRTFDEFKKIYYLDVKTMQAAYRLGLRTPCEVAKAFPMTSLSRLEGELLLVLVEEGAVKKPSELPWVVKHSWHYYRPHLSPAVIERTRRHVRLLLAYGVLPQQVAGVFRWSFERFAPEPLEPTLALLSASGINDLTTVLNEVGDCLWLAATDRWRFLLDEIKVTSAQDIGLFKALLESHRCVSSEMVRCLYRLGADLDGVACCQSMLLEIARQDTQPVADLERLASVHALSIGQLAECTSYLDGRNDLAEYLSVLSRHGYEDATSIVAFQVCYGRVGAVSLDYWLSVVGERGRGESAEAIAGWVLLAGKGGYLNSFEYLVSAIEMPNLASLHQVLKLAKMGAALLRYLVEERGLKTQKSIRDWYSNDADGIQDYQGRGFYDAADKVLLDDAFARKRFNLLESNHACLGDVVRRRVTEQLGSWPYKESEATREAYRSAFEAASLRERNMLLIRLPDLLDRAGGVLLPSLLESLWGSPEALEALLSQLSPLWEALLEGRGPTASTPTRLEFDAIALVYCTAPDTVKQHWSRVVGREHDIDRFQLRSTYPMVWERTQWRIKRPLDFRGLDALEQAVHFCARFSPDNFTDMFAACKHLRPGLLAERSADVLLLVQHLGVLLAVASPDSVVMEWIRDGFASLTEIDEESVMAYRRIRELNDFFSVVLPDALDAHQEQFMKRFNDKDALHLASRLGVVVPENAEEKAHDCLLQALNSTREKVLGVFSSWAKSEVRKFDASGKLDGQVSRFSAVVSKHPAAFFAKEAVQLCTSANVDMWCEERHTHLLVFDPTGKRLVGMAMLYIEPIQALHRTRQSLIIRAINPTKQAMASHDAASIVDAFLDVATQIAEENNLACVAFPTDAGMHLLSNRKEIEDDIKARFISQASKRRLFDARGVSLSWPDKPVVVEAAFDAYEKGQARVETLYVIWSAALPQQQAEDTVIRYGC